MGLHAIPRIVKQVPVISRGRSGRPGANNTWRRGRVGEPSHYSRSQSTVVLTGIREQPPQESSSGAKRTDTLKTLGRALGPMKDSCTLTEIDDRPRARSTVATDTAGDFSHMYGGAAVAKKEWHGTPA